MHQIKWSESIWFSDIDDTLIDTAGTTLEASEGIRKVFADKFDNETAQKIQDCFNDTFRIMLAGLRNKSNEDWLKSNVKKAVFENLWEQVENCQQEIINQYGAVKKFSREVFIKICADKAGITVTPDTVNEAADAYWMTLSQKTKFFPGVLDLIKEIKKNGRPICLVTSSDARLKLKPNGQFKYIPRYSEDFKRERIQLLKEKGMDFNVISIGDPEDKPFLDFFEKAVKLAEANLNMSINLSNAIMMGDSYGADLQTPKEKMGFGLTVLYRHGKENTEVVDGHQINTGNLFEVAKFLV